MSVTKAQLLKLKPGTQVSIYPGGGHLPEAHWHAVIVEHVMHPADGKPAGITTVECTDPHGFQNNRVGLHVDVDTKTIRPDNTDQENEK